MLFEIYHRNGLHMVKMAVNEKHDAVTEVFLPDMLELWIPAGRIGSISLIRRCASGSARWLTLPRSEGSS